VLITLHSIAFPVPPFRLLGRRVDIRHRWYPIGSALSTANSSRYRTKIDSAKAASANAVTSVTGTAAADRSSFRCLVVRRHRPQSGKRHQSDLAVGEIRLEAQPLEYYD
jgi:hypothetical protein